MFLVEADWSKALKDGTQECRCYLEVGSTGFEQSLGETPHMLMQSSERIITQSYRPIVISLRHYHCAPVQEILPVVLGCSVASSSFPGRLCLSANSVHHSRGAIQVFSNLSLNLSRIVFDVHKC